MNKYVVALTGLLVGAGAGFLIGKKLYEKKYEAMAQEEIDSVKEMYREKLEKMQDEHAQIFNVELNTKNAPHTEEEYQRFVDHIKSENDLSISRKTGTGNAHVNYNEIAKAKLKEKMDKDAHNTPEPDEDAPESDEDNEELTDEAGYPEHGMGASDVERDLTGIDRTKPYLIDDSEFENEFPQHDKIELTYYTKDDVLCDDHGTPMDDDDIEDNVGWDFFKVLEKENRVFVRNEPMESDFEILAARESYSESVHGVKESPKNLTPREQYILRHKNDKNQE